MPHYFFDLSDEMVLLDREGEELADDAAAQHHAMQLASRLQASVADVACNRWRSWNVCVRNEQDRVVAEIPFDSVLASARRSEAD